MDAGLPASIQKLLWDADIRSLDERVHRRLIMERVLNYGALADWRWLVARYGADSKYPRGTHCPKYVFQKCDSRRVATARLDDTPMTSPQQLSV